tara:strand:+ start:321 stop:665 length:345 start_codon:yes stop_codon:yes gene_type:complete
MANNFKNAGASGVSTSSGSPTTIYTSNNGTAVNSILIELDVANTGTSAVAASVLLYDTSATTSYHIVKDAPIPAGSTMKVVSGQKIVLNNDDEIRVYATAATVDVVASILEDVN